MAALLAPASAPAARGDDGREATRAALDFNLERRPIIAENLYSFKDLPEIDEEGRVGANLDGKGGFSVSHQGGGDVYIRAGIVRRRPNRIEDGLRAFAWAFEQQNPDGSFPDTDQAEAYAFFVESVAHSILLLGERPIYVERYGEQLGALERGLRRAIPHMIEAEAWKQFRYRNQFYTHSGYVMGTALGLAGRLLGEPKIRRHGRQAVKLALTRQEPNGVNPELGGYDVRYQMAGTAYAQRYVVYYPNGKLAREVKRMVRRSLAWMEPRIDRDGWINYRGSTRTCIEENSADNDKTPGYSYAIRAFGYWGALQMKERHFLTAGRMADYLDRRISDGSLCGPKDELEPPASEEEEEEQPSAQSRSDGGDDRGERVGTSRALRTQDLLE